MNETKELIMSVVRNLCRDDNVDEKYISAFADGVLCMHRLQESDVSFVYITEDELKKIFEGMMNVENIISSSIKES